jgi:hypothetical protein
MTKTYKIHPTGRPAAIYGLPVFTLVIPDHDSPLSAAIRDIEAKTGLTVYQRRTAGLTRSGLGQRFELHLGIPQETAYGTACKPKGTLLLDIFEIPVDE